MRTLLCVSFALVRRSEEAVVDANAEVASVTADAKIHMVRGEAAQKLEGAVCCGIPDAASPDDLIICLAASEDECSGEDATALDMSQCSQDVAQCVVHRDLDGPVEMDGELAEGEDEEVADAGVGDDCDATRPSSCGDGLVCSRGKCKYAAMEKCKPTWTVSNCASHPYGSGHKFQCKTHRTLGDKRCCIPSNSKHFGEAGQMLREQRPLTLKQYEAAHPDRTETKDGVTIKGMRKEEPVAYLTNYQTRRVPGRRFRREIVPGTGTMVHGQEKVFLTDACCSGWATYGRQGVTGDIGSDIEKKAEKRWFCGY